MNAGASRSLEVSFTPSDSEPVDTEVIVEFLPGGRTFIGVTGQGQNVDVALSTSSLTMDSSFISLLSHRALKIKNSSSQPVKYTWKSYKKGSDEEEERDRLLYEINRMQSIERASIMEKTGTGEFDLVVGEGDDALDMEGVEDQVPVLSFPVTVPASVVSMQVMELCRECLFLWRIKAYASTFHLLLFITPLSLSAEIEILILILVDSNILYYSPLSP